MTPTFTDFFKSFYYSNTYLSPVDLSDKGLSKHLLANDSPEIAKTIEGFISSNDIQEILAERLIYSKNNLDKYNKILEKHTFKQLSPAIENDEISPFSPTLEHKNLKGWIIKSGAPRVGEYQSSTLTNDRNEIALTRPEDSLLSIEMANRIAKVAQEAKIEVVLPKQKLVAYKQDDKEIKYCIVYEKIDVLEAQETFNRINGMNNEQQKELAKKISTIMQKAGLADASSIRLTSDGKLAFIDTEPTGLMIAKKPGLWNRLFCSKGSSVEKQARIGLYNLMEQVNQKAAGARQSLEPDEFEPPYLVDFYTRIREDYEKAATPKLSKWKIALSVASFGLIPIINAIRALVKTKLTKKICEKSIEINNRYENQRSNLKEALVNEKKLMEIFQCELPTHDEIHTLLSDLFQKQIIDHQRLEKQFLAYIENVPFKKAVAV